MGNLAELLRDRGVNLAWVARQCGVSPQFFHAVATGRKPCPDHLLAKLLDVLPRRPMTKTEVREALGL